MNKQLIKWVMKVDPTMNEDQAKQFIKYNNDGNELITAMENGIFNLTVHELTPDQLNAGAVEVSDVIKSQVKQLLTVSSEETDYTSLNAKAKSLAELAVSADLKHVLIGSGCPAMQAFVYNHLVTKGITAWYSHSDRVCKESVNADGTVNKQYTFKHLKFYTF